MPRSILVPAMLGLALTGCVSTKQWTATGGNKEAGLVRVSYQYSETHQPDLSDLQATALAENRCEAWGFKRADPVAGLVRECSSREAGNCQLWTVTREFQCSSGDGDASYATHLSK
ncbi:MAG: YecR family lipoprotein [Pseudomonadota bacterium]